MSEKNFLEVDRLNAMAGAYVEDVEMPDALRGLYGELVGYDALLAVEITGAEAPEKPWENPELVNSLKSLIESGRALNGVPKKLVTDYKSVVGKGENSLDALATRIQGLALSSYNYFNSENRLRQWNSQKSLLNNQTGFFNERAARRLSAQIPSMQPAVEGKYDRRTCVDALDLGLTRLRAASDLYKRVVENNDQMKLKAEFGEKPKLADTGSGVVGKKLSSSIPPPPPPSAKPEQEIEEFSLEGLDDLLKDGDGEEVEVVEMVEKPEATPTEKKPVRVTKPSTATVQKRPTETAKPADTKPPAIQPAATRPAVTKSPITTTEERPMEKKPVTPPSGTTAPRPKTQSR